MQEVPELVRNAAGQMIHTQIYRKACTAAFPDLMARGTYNLGLLPDPDEAVRWIETGRGEFGYGRPKRLRGFADPSFLAVQNRVPHECMGIVGVVHRHLDSKGVKSRDRFLHTELEHGSDTYVGHWEIEAGGALWDPSIPDEGCDSGAYGIISSTELYDMAKTGDKRFLRIREFPYMYSAMRVENPGISEEDAMRAFAIRTLAYDAWSMVNGAFMSGKQRIVLNDVPLGKSMGIEAQARLFNVHGQELRDAVEKGHDNKIKALLERYDAHLVSR